MSIEKRPGSIQQMPRKVQSGFDQRGLDQNEELWH